MLELDRAQLHDAPRVAVRWRADMIEGLGKSGDKFIIVLDMTRVFALDAPVTEAGAVAIAASRAG